MSTTLSKLSLSISFTKPDSVVSPVQYFSIHCAVVPLQRQQQSGHTILYVLAQSAVNRDKDFLTFGTENNKKWNGSLLSLSILSFISNMPLLLHMRVCTSKRSY